MTHANDLARKLVALHGGERPAPESFDTLHRVVFELRHLPLSLVAGLEEASQLSALPSDEAALLFELVREAGPGYASTSLFIEISNALGQTGPGS
jgi:hypothetical protein